MASKPFNKTFKEKLKKLVGNPMPNGTKQSHPYNVKHREHKTPEDVLDDFTNNQASPDGNEQLALSISNLREDIIQSLRSDIRTELKDMSNRLTETIKTQMNFAVSGGNCTLCRNKSEESKYANQLQNETDIIEQASDVSMPQASHNSEYSYANKQDIVDGTYVTPITQTDDDSKRPSYVTNPTYSRSIDDDIVMSIMTSSVNTIEDDKHYDVRKHSIKRPIPVPPTSISGSDKKKSSSYGFNFPQELESSMAYSKKASSEYTEITFIGNTLSDETHAKQFAGQSIHLKSQNKGLSRHFQRPKQPKAKGGHRAKFDERECLAKALQSHVQEIVATIVFKDSELPDKLIAGGVITEDESCAIRTIVYRKDQIRALLSLIKGRDLQVLKHFLEYIGDHCLSRELFDKISDTFEENKKANMTAKSCVLCKLNNQVNVKYVTDKLWSIFAIDDGIYNESIMCTNPTGSQLGLWEQLIHCINNLKRDTLTNAYDALCSTLEENNHYTHLSEAIKAKIDSDLYGNLRHTCFDTNIQLIQKYKRGTASPFGSTTSVSPQSSARSSVYTSFVRTPQEILQDDTGNISSPFRGFEKGKRQSGLEHEKQTAIQESQYKGIEKDTVSNSDNGNDHIDERSHQRSDRMSSQGSKKPPLLPHKKKQQNFKKEITKSKEDNKLHSSDV